MLSLFTVKSTEMEDLRIRRLVLDKVGVFEHLDLEFKESPAKDKAEIHIFVGENGTGKTTVLEAMTYFDGLKNNQLHLLQHSQGIRFNDLDLKAEGIGRKSYNSIEVYFGSSRNFWGNKTSSPAVATFLEAYYQKFYYQSLNHTYNFFAYNGRRHLEYHKVEAFKKVDFDPILEALTLSKTNLHSDVFQWIANEKTKSAFAFQKNNIEESERYLLTIKKIENAVGAIIGRKIEFMIDEYSLQVKIKLEGNEIHFQSLPDGYHSIISWLSDLLFRLDFMPETGKENFTLFLDEIDIHLHPKAQRRILPVIQKLFPKAQIFLTTHSPFIVGSVDDAWVYKFKLDENGHSVLDGEPRRSEDAKSYRTILEEVFDIKEEFGMEAQTQLDEFYQLRQEVLKGSTDSTWLTFNKLGMKLASQSPEMHSYVSLELRQAARILNRQLIH